jgi:phosphohistidine phosphatase
MPKNLYLLRHAHSIDKQPGQPDKERDLSAAGIKECFQMGGYLSKKRVRIDVIFSSSATRAKETTQLIADTIKYDPEKISTEDALYDASVRTFLEFINNIDDGFNAVMCVGHNPVISYLAEFLTHGEIGDMATGSMAAIAFDLSSWRQVGQSTGKLADYIVPASNMID